MGSLIPQVRYYPSLARLVYQIDIKIVFDFGEYVFEQVVKHDESYVVKLLIGFLSLIYGILIGYESDLITSEDEVVLDRNDVRFY